MNGKTLTKFILPALLISVLFASLSSVPVSMLMLGMGTMDSQMNHHSSHNTGDNHSTMPCCDVIVACCASVALIAPQFDDITLSGENKRVVNSNLAVHFVVIQNTSPPPKA